VIKKLVARQL